MALLIPLFAAIAPFLLWPIEQLLPYPHIIEELAKSLLVLMLRSGTWKVNNSESYSKQLKLMISAGILFALSESVLYLFNISLVGDLSVFLRRLILTSLLHILTFLVIFVASVKDIKLIVLGLAAASTIHYLFNLLIAD